MHTSQNPSIVKALDPLFVYPAFGRSALNTSSRDVHKRYPRGAPSSMSPRHIAGAELRFIMTLLTALEGKIRRNSHIWNCWLMIRGVAVILWLVAAVTSAPAQTGERAPQTGGVGLPAPVEPRTFGASAGTEILRHRAPTGIPCLTVGGFARPHVANQNVYDHIVTAKNTCAQSITMQVCYYKSQECQPMVIPGGERKEVILGSLPSARDFRFEFREKF